MLKPLRFVMHLVPGHAEHLREHAFNQVVAQRRAIRRLFTLRRKPDNAIGFYIDITVALQSAKRHRDSGRRYGEPVSECSRDHGLALALGFQNRLKVVLFGNADGGLHSQQNTVWASLAASFLCRTRPDRHCIANKNYYCLSASIC